MRTGITTSGQLGPLLKQLRVEKRLSQAALGAKIGLSQERISRIESRPEAVTMDQLLTVLMALDAVLSVAPRNALAVDAVAATSAVANSSTDHQDSW